MANRAAHKSLRYTEKQTRAYLSWLARGMQQHGQTVFMLEQLQPTWLATYNERAVYTFGSRLLIGVICGVSLAALHQIHHPSTLVLLGNLWFGMSFGISFAIHDTFRLARGVPTESIPTPSLWRRLKGVFIMGCILALAFFLGSQPSLLISGATKPEGSPFFRVFVIWGFAYLPSFAVLWGLRRSDRTLANDIRCVETLTWSWRHALFGCAPMLTLGLVLGLVIGLISGDILLHLFVGLCLVTPVGLLVTAIAAMRTGVKDSKNVPNQGVILSMLSAVYGGLVIGAIAFLCFGLFSFALRSGRGDANASELSHFKMGQLDGLVIGLEAALVAGLWFGGLDAILHFFLRVMLFVRGHAPLNLVRFLDYAAKELNFLQKVGGGYIFIHRMLLEHFAVVEYETALDRQPSHGLAGTTTIASLSED